ncbi:MAG: CRISPR-associated endonuclease Cas3'' [Shewanella sp.]|nr:CRISPR-associated endonuclease Cas3'' [Shewanella sp.]
MVLIANTHKQRLENHCFAVGYLSKLIVERLIEDESQSKILSTAAYIAGVYHDTGKCDPLFQSWVTQSDSGDTHIDTDAFSFENYPRHNEVSLLLYELINSGQYCNKSITNRHIPHSIYFHHEKPFRKNPIDSINDIFEKVNAHQDMKALCSTAIELITDVNDIACRYADNLQSLSLLNTDDIEYDFFSVLPEYKTYSVSQLSRYEKYISSNAINNILRAVVIKADRIVSSLTAEKLNELIETQSLCSILFDDFDESLSNAITDCLSEFEKKGDTERNQKQNEVVTQVIESLNEQHELNNAASISVLSGAAGCGKTKIALAVAQERKAKQIIWVCPTVSVALSMYRELSQEYLSSCNVEIVTGEYKLTSRNNEEYETSEHNLYQSDVVITNIDSIVNMISTHRDSVSFIDFMKSFVVFDEFHELAVTQGFNLLFAELVKAKQFAGFNANTLLVSATINPVFCRDVLNIDDSLIHSMNTFNESKYTLSVERSDNPSQRLQQDKAVEDHFIICNKATDAQLGFIANQQNEHSLLIHSKFTKHDKSQLLSQVIKSFGRSGSGEYTGLRSSPMLQSSLNITCKSMMTDATSPENLLQRIGRLGRFAENATNSLKILIDNGSNRFLKSMNIYHSTHAFIDFLSCNNAINTAITLTELYELYHRFYQSSDSLEQVRLDLTRLLEQSVNLINSHKFDPMWFPAAKKDGSKEGRLKTNSLRANSRYVQLAVCTVADDFTPTFLNQYAIKDNDSMTLNVEQLTSYEFDDDKKNLVRYMYVKQPFVDGTGKDKRGIAGLIAAAKNSDTPIFTSYDEQGLSRIENHRSDYGIYYAISDSQPVGAISLEILNKNK